MNIDVRTLTALVVLVSAATASGCVIKDPDEDTATASAASALTSTRNAGTTNNLGASLKAGVCVTPEAVAAEVASEPPVGVYPPSCVTKTANGAKLHVEYDDCTGAFGKVHVSGGVDATFTAGASCDMLHADVRDSGNLVGNSAPIQYQAGADITIKGTERDIGWKSVWTADTWIGTANGDDDLQVEQDATTFCLDVSGTSKAHLDSWDGTSTLSGVKVCPAACPSAGTIDVKTDGAFNDHSLTITFDGSDQAHVVGTRGQHFDVNLVCDK